MSESCSQDNEKYSAENEFTVSFGDTDHVAACDYVGIASGNNTPDKLERAVFTTVMSECVDAPVINELPLVLECKFVRFTEEGNVIGEIVNINADEKILDENGNIDVTKLKLIAYKPVRNEYYVMGEKVGNAFSDGNALK